MKYRIQFSVNVDVDDGHFDPQATLANAIEDASSALDLAISSSLGMTGLGMKIDVTQIADREQWLQKRERYQPFVEPSANVAPADRGEPGWPFVPRG